MKKLFDLLTGKHRKQEAVPASTAAPHIEPPATSPEARVTAFIAHWHREWTRARAEMGQNVDFERWGAQIASVDRAHYLPGHRCGSHTSYSSVPDHDARQEQIIDCTIDGDSACVHTRLHSTAYPLVRYHGFDLKRDAEGNWLIEQMHSALSPPTESLLRPTELDALRAMSRADAPLTAAPDDLLLKEATLFQGSRALATEAITGEVTQARIGTLAISSGVLGIKDLGYDFHGFKPLHRRAPIGRFPVEAVNVGRHVAGIRVLFREDAPASQWRAASTEDGRSIHSSDAANLAIFDLDALVDLSEMDKERAFSGWNSRMETRLLSLRAANDCVIASSGYGDGSYPAQWGLDDSGEVVSLYIDFLVLVEETADGRYVSV